jgi:hypothetical protein
MNHITFILVNELKKSPTINQLFLQGHFAHGICTGQDVVKRHDVHILLIAHVQQHGDISMPNRNSIQKKT